MARKSFYKITLEEDSVVNDVEVSEAEIAKAEHEVEVSNNEIQDDIATVEESQEVVNELQEQVTENEEILENNPETVTDELVQASNESFMYAMGKLGVPRDHIRYYKVSPESYSTPLERLKLSNENAKEFISKIIEKIKAFFKTIWDKIKAFIRKIGVMLGLVKNDLKKTVQVAKKSPIKEPELSPEDKSEIKKIVKDAIDNKQPINKQLPAPAKPEDIMREALSKFIYKYGHLMGDGAGDEFAQGMISLIERPLKLKFLIDIDDVDPINLKEKLKSYQTVCDKNFFNYGSYKDTRDGDDKEFLLVIGICVIHNPVLGSMIHTIDYYKKYMMGSSRVGSIDYDLTYVRLLDYKIDEWVECNFAKKESLLYMAKVILGNMDNVTRTITYNTDSLRPKAEEFINKYNKIVHSIEENEYTNDIPKLATQFNLYKLYLEYYSTIFLKECAIFTKDLNDLIKVIYCK